MQEDEEAAALGLSLLSPEGSGRRLKNGSAVGMNLLNKSEVDVGVTETSGAAGKPLQTYDLTGLNQASEAEIAATLPEEAAA